MLPNRLYAKYLICLALISSSAFSLTRNQYVKKSEERKNIYKNLKTEQSGKEYFISARYYIGYKYLVDIFKNTGATCKQASEELPLEYLPVNGKLSKENYIPKEVKEIIKDLNKNCKD